MSAEIEALDPMCGEVEASCICNLPRHAADQPHVCECSGSWTFDEKGKFVLVRLPGPFGAMFGGGKS